MADEITTPGADVDLFGAPVDQIKERWGRPGFAKSPENQRLVALLRAASWGQERIATYLRCDVKTLRKHFSRELTAGADLTEGQVLEVMMQRTRQGNVAAGKKILAVIEAGRAGVPPPPPRPDAPEDEPGDTAPRLGKKEQQIEAAKNPGSGWGSLLN